MVRPKTYILSDVLNKATDIFWEKGYEATSMKMLVDGTGMNRHSMYEEFGSKKGVFKAALEFYVDQAKAMLLTKFEKEPLGIQNIVAFFNAASELIDEDMLCKGCFLVNTAVDRNIMDDDINRIVKAYFDYKEDLLYRNIRAAHDRGDIPQNKDPKRVAKVLNSAIQGMVVIGKVNTDPNERKLLAETLLEEITT